jgi:hypothetical protein
MLLPRGVPAGVVGACAPAEEVPRDELRRPAAVRPARHETHRLSRHLLTQLMSSSLVLLPKPNTKREEHATRAVDEEDEKE